MFPLVSFEEVSRAATNRCLSAWNHKMGPLERGNESGTHFALMHHGEPVAICSQSTLIAPAVGGGMGHLTRDNTCELSRLCAIRPHLCRVALRLWREFVFPALGFQYAMSYQDADLHNGATYRFDGWTRNDKIAHSGIDTRSGRPGRNKWIWVWERPRVETQSLPAIAEADSE